MLTPTPFKNEQVKAGNIILMDNGFNNFNAKNKKENVNLHNKYQNKLIKNYPNVNTHMQANMCGNNSEINNFNNQISNPNPNPNQNYNRFKSNNYVSKYPVEISYNKNYNDRNNYNANKQIKNNFNNVNNSLPYNNYQNHNYIVNSFGYGGNINSTNNNITYKVIDAEDYMRKKNLDNVSNR